MKTIRFKSTPNNYRKEYLGIKPCTVRVFKLLTKDLRLNMLEEYIRGDLTNLNIEITNNTTQENFTREVIDITYYEERYIISWRP